MDRATSSRSFPRTPSVADALGYGTSLGTWLVMTVISGFAIVMLPRQFYVMIVENRSETELRTGDLDLSALSRRHQLLRAAHRLRRSRHGRRLQPAATSTSCRCHCFPATIRWRMIAFVGGLSAATAMVIVESVALSIMISNDLIIPLFVRRLLKTETSESGDWSTLILNIRRASIFVILLLAFLYYRESTGNTRLASIGLMSFAAIAQFAPAFIGGLVWRRANARGAALGMCGGHCRLVLHACSSRRWHRQPM